MLIDFRRAFDKGGRHHLCQRRRVSLTNNGIMYLFSNISYRLSNQEIESVRHPGQATTMLGLLKYSDDFSKAQGLNQLWQKDTAGTAVVADNEGFKSQTKVPHSVTSS